MKKVLSLIIAVSMIILALTLCACGENPEPTPTTAGKDATQATTVPPTSQSTENPTPSTEPTTAGTTGGGEDVTPSENNGYSKLEGFLDVDFANREFVFATTDGSTNWYTQYEVEVDSRDGGTIVNTAVYDRNEVMKKLYKCSVKAVPVENPKRVIEDDVVSGTNKYDFAVWEGEAYFKNQNNAFRNILDLDLDFTIPGWNTDMIEQCTCADNNGVKKLFTFDGDFGLMGVDAIWTMIVNLDLFEQNFDDDIFEIVRTHEWTVDKFEEYCVAIAKDNGDQKWVVGDDVYGYISTGQGMPAMIEGVGISLTYKNDAGKLATSKDYITESGVETKVQRLCDLFANDGMDDSTSYMKVSSYLAEGKALFMSQVMGVLTSETSEEAGTAGFINLDVSVSPLPMPLYKAGDDYHTYVNNRGAFYGISKNACGGNADMISDFWNLYAFHSNKIVRPAILKFIGEINCSNENAPEMVDIVMNSRTYDFVYHNCNTYPALGTDILNNVNNVGKAANSWVKDINKSINEYLDYISK